MSLTDINQDIDICLLKYIIGMQDFDIEEVSKLFTKDNQAVLVDLGNQKHHIITKYDIIGSIK